MKLVGCGNIADYIAESCDYNTNAGVGKLGYIIEYAADQIVSITKDPTTGCITDIVLQPTVKLRSFSINKSTGLAEIESTLTDNNGRSKTDTFNMQTSIQDCTGLNWWQNIENPNVEVMMILPLNSEDQKYLVVGHDGGLQNTQWKFTSGQASEDFTGFEATFLNNTRQTGVFLAADATLYVLGNDELLSSLL